MPRWTNEVPEDPRGHGFQILRTPPAKPLSAIVTSTDLIGCHTHFYHGRTKPCEHKECQPCKEGIPFRWHAYLSAFRPPDHFHFIFEVTAQAAEYFTSYRDQVGTLRGCLFTATRHDRKVNGRVLLQVRTADLSKIILPDPPDIPKCLAVLWDLPT